MVSAGAILEGLDVSVDSGSSISDPPGAQLAVMDWGCDVPEELPRRGRVARDHDAGGCVGCLEH